MTEGPDTSEPHGLVGGYLLDALTDLERQRFERHLSGCPDCRDEVAELRESLAAVSLLSATEPPAQLRDQVLSSARSVRPLPPRTDDPVVGRSQRRTGRIWRLVAAVAVVVAMASGGWAINQQLNVRQQAAEIATAAQREADLMTAPDVELRPMQLAEGGRGSLVMSRTRGEAMFLAGSLPPPAAGRAYQAWWMRDGKPVADAWFDADPSRIWLHGDPNGAAALALTQEPIGGSQSPTSPILATVTL